MEKKTLKIGKQRTFEIVFMTFEIVLIYIYKDIYEGR